MKSIRVIILIAAIAVLTACSNNKMKHDATGTFESTEVIVSAEAMGKLLAFNVEEGMYLSKDIVVGVVDSLQLYLKKEQLIKNRSAVLSQKQDIEKQIEATKQEIANQERERDRQIRLIKANAGNQKHLDDIVGRVDVLNGQLQAQQSSLSIANNSINEQAEVIDVQIAQVADQLNKCKITSPIDGTVLVKYAEMGELANVGKPLFKIADVNKMILRAYITANQLSQVKLGQRVKVYIDADDSSYKEYQGVVEWISDKAEFTPKTIQTKDERANLVYAIKINVINDGMIKIGMYGEVSISDK